MHLDPQKKSFPDTTTRASNAEILAGSAAGHATPDLLSPDIRGAGFSPHVRGGRVSDKAARHVGRFESPDKTSWRMATHCRCLAALSFRTRAPDYLNLL